MSLLCNENLAVRVVRGGDDEDDEGQRTAKAWGLHSTSSSIVGLEPCGASRWATAGTHVDTMMGWLPGPPIAWLVLHTDWCRLGPRVGRAWKRLGAGHKRSPGMHGVATTTATTLPVATTWTPVPPSSSVDKGTVARMATFS